MSRCDNVGGEVDGIGSMEGVIGWRVKGGVGGGQVLSQYSNGLFSRGVRKWF
jgi:hypothetical protein